MWNSSSSSLESYGPNREASYIGIFLLHPLPSTAVYWAPTIWVFPGGSEVQVSACNVGNLGSIPGLGSSPGVGIDYTCTPVFLGFPGGSDGKESAWNVGNLGSIPGLGRSPGGGHGNPLQYSSLENPYGQRSLVGYSPWVHKESDTIERLSTHTTE